MNIWLFEQMLQICLFYAYLQQQVAVEIINLDLPTYLPHLPPQFLQTPMHILQDNHF